MALTREEALDRLEELYATKFIADMPITKQFTDGDFDKARRFTDEEFAEAVKLVNIIQDAQEDEDNELDQPDDDESGPLTALMSEDQREQMVRF